ncbi:MAG: nitroreductase family protein [Bacteroides sp.]|nr:nitroreductase family protein [Roseburia sp.]MCM1345838.1 nitroreductase family protein [Bacteroides sp.]MCM1420228.1 nitroreductase family protein [Bacteroides sp.]
MTSIKDRRTIRKYKNDEVPTDLLDTLFKTASRAATMGNMQLYSVVNTRDEKIKEELSPWHFNQPMVKNAPVVLTFCVDFNRFTHWCRLRKAEPGYDNFLSFICAMSDTLLFTQNFCTLAEEAGLGTCYLGTTVYNAQGIIDVLKLPKLTFPIATITVGWPDEEPAQPDRLPVSTLVHEDVYRDYTAEDIDKAYMLKESLEENKHFVEVNGKETLAQVFTDCRYTKNDNEAMSATLLDALKNQGFM